MWGAIFKCTFSCSMKKWRTVISNARKEDFRFAGIVCSILHPERSNFAAYNKQTLKGLLLNIFFSFFISDMLLNLLLWRNFRDLTDQLLTTLLKDSTFHNKEIAEMRGKVRKLAFLIPWGIYNLPLFRWLTICTNAIQRIRLMYHFLSLLQTVKQIER